MELKSHGRYDYSAITERKDYSWPGGKRLAVRFCLNVERFSFGEGLGNLVDQFDEMLEESAERPLVMSVVLHSFILGQPHRLRRFRKVIEHIVAERERVWLTRPGEICRYIESLPPGVVPGS